MQIKLFTLCSLMFLSFPAYALDPLQPMNNGLAEPSMDDCKDGKCPVPPKPVCFNIFCSYERKDHERDKDYAKCQTAARFNKLVGIDGREFQDNSNLKHPAEFEVECDHQLLFNGSGKRFTDELGTRIQGDGGPYPATLLPKGALREGHRYTLSSLELDGQVLHGYCYIYSGSP